MIATLAKNKKFLKKIKIKTLGLRLWSQLFLLRLVHVRSGQVRSGPGFVLTSEHLRSSYG
jgi:hypothetical protein